MAKFSFDFKDDESAGNTDEMATFEAAIIAAAASLALTAMESGASQCETVVVVGDDTGRKSRVRLSLTVEAMD